MRFFTVNTLVDFLKENHEKELEQIHLVFSGDNLQKDEKYNTYHAKVLLLVLKEKDNKNSIILKHEDILNMFEDMITINVNEPTVGKDKIYDLSINPTDKYSEKFACVYHEKKYNIPGPKLVRLAKEEIKNNEILYAPQVFDI